MIHTPRNLVADPTIVVIRNNTALAVNIGSPSVPFAANETLFFANTYWKTVYASDESTIDTKLNADDLDFMLLPDYVGTLG